MSAVNVRYIVDDVEQAIRFYEEHLDFKTKMHPAPGFAALTRGDLTLLLNAPGAGGAGKAGAEGEETPRPGGWARFQVAVEDLESTLAALEEIGVRVRGGIVHGTGGDQAVIEDPSGNPVELFQPRGRARR